MTRAGFTFYECTNSAGNFTYKNFKNDRPIKKRGGEGKLSRLVLEILALRRMSPESRVSATYFYHGCHRSRY